MNHEVQKHINALYPWD